MSRTFQLTLIFPEMTVFDCVWVGVNANAKGAGRLFFSRVDETGDTARRAIEIIRLVGLEDAWLTTSLPEARYPDLSPGTYRIVETQPAGYNSVGARAAMTRPRATMARYRTTRRIAPT